MDQGRKSILLALAAASSAAFGRASVIVTMAAMLAGVAQSAAPAYPEHMVATVRAADVPHRTLDLMTGVGYAIRVWHVEMPADLSIKSRGATTSLAALSPGSIVEIQFRKTPTGPVPSECRLIAAPPAVPRR